MFDDRNILPPFSKLTRKIMTCGLLFTVSYFFLLEKNYFTFGQLSTNGKRKIDTVENGVKWIKLFFVSVLPISMHFNNLVKMRDYL